MANHPTTSAGRSRDDERDEREQTARARAAREQAEREHATAGGTTHRGPANMTVQPSGDGNTIAVSGAMHRPFLGAADPEPLTVVLEAPVYPPDILPWYPVKTELAVARAAIDATAATSPPAPRFVRAAVDEPLVPSPPGPNPPGPNPTTSE